MIIPIRIPAVRGRQADREYFVVIIPLGLIPKLFYYNEELLPPELRSQRALNEKRIPEIADYILENDDWVFSSVSATVNGAMEFVPCSEETPDLGMLNIDMNATIIINDGQHRRAGILEAMKQDPDLANETISVVLHRFESINRSNQMFADLNRYAEKPSKSLNLLYDTRDPLSGAVNRMLEQIEFFDVYTERERTSLPPRSPRLFTLSSLYEANRRLLRMTKRKLREFSDNEVQTMVEFWQGVYEHMPLWGMVHRGELRPRDLREQYICSHSVSVQAIGVVGSYLLDEPDWRECLGGLERIDWSRENEDWMGIAILDNGRVVNSNTALNLTSLYIRKELGLPLSASDQNKLARVSR
ncbi:MAG: DNA sulfur modification protein DndB [Syntrophomonadaceae bacterium]|nr:DNA sulfur modification protein DndB [Syntrophomonadaceae bacterium]